MNKGEMFLEHYFDRRTQPERDWLTDLKREGAGYEYQCPVLSDSFLLKVRVCDQKLSFQVYDQDTGTVYPDPSGTTTRKFRWPSRSLSEESCKNSPSILKVRLYLNQAPPWPISLCLYQRRLVFVGIPRIWCHSPPRHPQVVWCLYDRDWKKLDAVWENRSFGY